jgi:CelD/BcsL family acetyltransferase involved in cellulose biosynthesis
VGAPILQTRPAATAASAADVVAPATRVAGARVRLSALEPAQARYEIRIDRALDDIVQRLRDLPQTMASTAFQTPVWLASWYATIGKAIGEPMLVTVADNRSGEVAAILPLVRRTTCGLAIVEFADGGVSDNNGPILGPAAPTDRAGAIVLWDALRSALGGIGLVRFTKMPMTIDGRVNPFALLDGNHAAAVNRNVVTIDGTWERYLKSLERRFRKELGRSWRVFLGHEGAAFERITDVDHAARVLAELERQQSDHMKDRAKYILDQPAVAEFFRKLLVDGRDDGSVILTALTRGTEVVSALLGIVRGDTYVMVRISSGAKEWSNCSPGRLVIVRTMEMLHAQGFRHFDFSIGNYPYKRRLGVEAQPLCDFVIALSYYGLPLQLWDRACHLIRRGFGGVLRRLLAASWHRALPSSTLKRLATSQTLARF